MGTAFTKLWFLLLFVILTSELEGCKWHQNSKNSEVHGTLPMANLIDDRKQEFHLDIPFSRINVITDIPQLKARSIKSKRSLVFRFPKKNSVNTFRNVRSFKDLKLIKPMENVPSKQLKKMGFTANNKIKNESKIISEKPNGKVKDTKSVTDINEMESLSLAQQTTSQNNFFKKGFSTTVRPESSIKTSPELNVHQLKKGTTNPKTDIKQTFETSQKQMTVIRPIAKKFQHMKKELLTVVAPETASVKPKLETKTKMLEKALGIPQMNVKQIVQSSLKQITASKLFSRQALSKGKESQPSVMPEKPSVDTRSRVVKKLGEYIGNTEKDVKQIQKSSQQQAIRTLSGGVTITEKELPIKVLSENSSVEPKKKTKTKLFVKSINSPRTNIKELIKSSQRQKPAFIPLSRRFKFIEKELSTTVIPDTTTAKVYIEPKTRKPNDITDIDVEKILKSSQRQTAVFKPFSRRFQNFKMRNAAAFTFSTKKPKKIQKKKKEIKNDDLASKLLKLLSNTTIKLSTTMSPYASESEPQIQATSISTTPVPVEITSDPDSSLTLASDEPINYHTLNIVSKLDYLQRQLKKIKSQSKEMHHKSDKTDRLVKESSSFKKTKIKTRTEPAKDYVGNKNLHHKSSDVETMQTIMESIGKVIKIVNSKSNLSKDTMKLLQKKVANLKSRIATRNGLIPSMSLSNIMETNQRMETDVSRKDSKVNIQENINVSKKTMKKTTKESKAKVAEISTKQKSKNKDENNLTSVKKNEGNALSSTSYPTTTNISNKDFDQKVEQRNKIPQNLKAPYVQDNLLEWRPIGEIKQDIYNLNKKSYKMKKSDFYETPLKIKKIRKPKNQKRRKPPKVKGGKEIRNKGINTINGRTPPLPKPPKSSLKNQNMNIPEPPQDLSFHVQGQSLNKFSRNVPQQRFNSKSDFVASQVDPMNKRPTYSDWINLKTGFRTKEPTEIRFEFAPVPSESAGKSKAKSPLDGSIPLPPSNNEYLMTTGIPKNINSIYGKRIPTPPNDPYQMMKDSINTPYDPPKKRNQRVQMKPEKHFNEQLFRNNNARIPWSKPDQFFPNQLQKPFNQKQQSVDNTMRDWNNNYMDRAQYKMGGPTTSLNGWGINEKRKKNSEKAQLNRQSPSRDQYMTDPVLQSKIQFYESSRGANSMKNHEGRHKPYDRPNTAINNRKMFNERSNRGANGMRNHDARNTAFDRPNMAVNKREMLKERNNRGANVMGNHEGRHKPYDRPNMAVNKREMFNERQMFQRDGMGPMGQRGNTLYNREPYWRTPGPFQRQRTQNWWATTPSVFMNNQMYMNPFINSFGMALGLRNNYNPAYPRGPQAWQQRVESTTSKYEVARDFLDTFWQNQQGEANFDKSLGKGRFQQRFVPIKPSPLDNSPPKMKRIWKAKKAGGEIIYEYAKIFPYMELIYIFSSFKSAVLIDYHHNKMAFKFKLPSSVAAFGEVCFIKSAPFTFTKAESEIRQRETSKTLDVVEGGIFYAELSGKIKRGQVRKIAGPEIYDFCNTAISRGHIFKLVSEPMSDVGNTHFHASGLLSGQTKGPVSTLTITVDNAIDLNARM